MANSLTDVSDNPLKLIYGDAHRPTLGGFYGGVFDAARLTRENICHQAIFYGRGVFDLLGTFDLQYKICADFALNIRSFGHPAISKTHLDLVVADFEGGGVSDDYDRVFTADWPALAWNHLGPIFGVETYYRFSGRMRWLRWLTYQFRRPFRTVPGRSRCAPLG